MVPFSTAYSEHVFQYHSFAKFSSFHSFWDFLSMFIGKHWNFVNHYKCKWNNKQRLKAELFSWMLWIQNHKNQNETENLQYEIWMIWKPVMHLKCAHNHLSFMAFSFCYLLLREIVHDLLGIGLVGTVLEAKVPFQWPAGLLHVYGPSGSMFGNAHGWWLLDPRWIRKTLGTMTFSQAKVKAKISLHKWLFQVVSSKFLIT